MKKRVVLHLLLSSVVSATCITVAHALLVPGPCSKDAVAATGCLRSLGRAQADYLRDHGTYGYAKELFEGGYIGASFFRTSGSYAYLYFLSDDKQSFSIRAEPSDRSDWWWPRFRDDYFYLDQDGVIRTSHGRRAGPDDAIVRYPERFTVRVTDDGTIK